MHLLPTSSTTSRRDRRAGRSRPAAGRHRGAVLRRQRPGRAGRRLGHRADALPRVRLAQLRDLRHPMSVDLWIDRVARHAKVILVRLLGGLDWWRYGVEALAAVRASAASRLPFCRARTATIRASRGLDPAADELAALLRYFREGGRENLRALLRRSPAMPAHATGAAEPQPVPRIAGYLPGQRRGRRSTALAAHARARAAGGADHLLSRAAARRRHRADRCAVRGAGGARARAGAALRHEPEGPEAAAFVRGALARLAAGGHRHHHGVCRRRRRASRRRSTAPTCRCCRR